MKTDTELLKELLEVFWLDDNELRWPFETDGLRDAGFDNKYIDELIERQRQFEEGK
jgi:hypothetical protein